MTYIPKLVSVISICTTALSVFLASTDDAKARDGDPVWRVEIEFTTADISDASSDDDIEVRLNGENSTLLDYARDDFERGTTLNYDLNLDGVTTIGDIDRIEISKNGSDGWCVESFRVTVNNIRVYEREFDDPFLCLDNSANLERRFEVDGDTLRDDTLWDDYTHPINREIIARGIPKEETISRIEGIAGHSRHGTRVYWGKFHGDPIELERLSDDRVHIDLDMAFSRRFNFDDSYDVDLDMVVTCSNGQISIAFENIEADLDFKWYKLFLGPNTYLFTSTADGLTIGSTSSGLHSFVRGCPVISVENDGDVVFTEPVPRVLDVPIDDLDVGDCTYSPTLESFVVTTRGSSSEHGGPGASNVHRVGLDGAVYETPLGLVPNDDETGAHYSSPKILGDTLYLAQHQRLASGDDLASISLWDIQTGAKTDQVDLRNVAGIREFAVSQSGDIFVVEEGPTSRVFKVSQGRVVEFAADARRQLGVISGISLDDQGMVMLVGYDANLGLVFDQNGALVRRSILNANGVSRAVQHSDETTFVSDGQRAALTQIDGNGIATDIHLDAPYVDAFCLSDTAEFALIPFTVQDGFGVYPLDLAKGK